MSKNFEMILKQIIFSFAVLMIGSVLARSYRKVPIKIPNEITPQSCLDYLKKGYKSNGYYSIYNFRTTKSFTVYCDINSEAGAAWTLVMSYALKNIGMSQFTRNPFWKNTPVNQNSPNWSLYRMSLSQMNHLKSQSTHWRSTCNFPTQGIDYTDYVRGNFAEFDAMTTSGSALCKKVEYVNIRGHQCADCTARWWQVEGHHGLHIDSSHSGCQFVPTRGATSSENNFGFYLDGMNKKFRCSAGPSSTTNWWFGGYI